MQTLPDQHRLAAFLWKTASVADLSDSSNYSNTNFHIQGQNVNVKCLIRPLKALIRPLSGLGKALLKAVDFFVLKTFGKPLKVLCKAF